MAQQKKLEDPVKYRAPALEKGLDIIELLAAHESGMTQSAIAKSLDKSQGEIYRMLSTLVRRGYVSRVAKDQYSLSLKLFSTAQQHAPIERVLEVAQPLMRQFARSIRQSCHIVMENDAAIVVILSVEAPGNWGLMIRTGAVLGLWNSGAGRVLAAFRSEAEREELISGHAPVSGEPPLDRDKFLTEVAEVKRRGYYNKKSETLYGVTNLTYPIFDPSGNAIAALTCPYLERVDGHKAASRKDAAREISKIAEELSAYFRGEHLTGMETK
ncbi:MULTISPECIES: IclR family transcriptional regulator [Halocynthiibacter]|uniref:IclR family transcriptional regulator n=1 Tax=Halocynthiibacter halioticoli TaxID=2986804 RepID=A0AAE3LQF9_9RHOB|nr:MULTISPECIES: IclR family transcriptional regulator [Halocynthiibacter]MCV6823484.1 IclR family transcriptional regulator [Halocynthiibacter halioticoli]MCW4056485.1 IclR family transcriptional regulator [Halocynthiibacter sp. SDUM655004]